MKIELPADPQLRSGLFGRAQFSRGQRPSLLIPRTALVERGQLQGVYVLDQNKIAALRYVTLGRPPGEKVEVLAGLQEGERLVADAGRTRSERQTHRGPVDDRRIMTSRRISLRSACAWQDASPAASSIPS